MSLQRLRPAECAAPSRSPRELRGVPHKIRNVGGAHQRRVPLRHRPARRPAPRAGRTAPRSADRSAARDVVDLARHARAPAARRTLRRRRAHRGSRAPARGCRSAPPAPRRLASRSRLDECRHHEIGGLARPGVRKRPRDDHAEPGPPRRLRAPPPRRPACSRRRASPAPPGRSRRSARPSGRVRTPRRSRRSAPADRPRRPARRRAPARPRAAPYRAAFTSHARPGSRRAALTEASAARCTHPVARPRRQRAATDSTSPSSSGTPFDLTLTSRPRAGTLAPRPVARDHVMATRPQYRQDVPADETVRAGHEHLHRRAPPLARSASTIMRTSCAKDTAGRPLAARVARLPRIGLSRSTSAGPDERRVDHHVLLPVEAHVAEGDLAPARARCASRRCR